MYHCVDRWSAFKGYNPAVMIAGEAEICRSALERNPENALALFNLACCESLHRRKSSRRRRPCASTRRSVS